MTLLDFLRMTRANLLVLVLGVLLGALAGFGYGELQPKTYVASSTGYVTVVGSDGAGEVLSGDSAAASKAAAYVPLITSGRVAEVIAKEPGVDMGTGEIQSSLSAEVVENTAQLRVTATSTDPDKAVTLANSSLKATAQVVREIEGSGSAVKVIPLDDATRPGAPASPNIKKLTLLGAGVGLVLAYLLVFARRYLDTRLRTAQDLEAASGVGVLGTLPRTEAFDENRFLTDQADHQSQEALRQLRTNLRFVNVDNPPRSVIVTSPNPGEGKSTVSASLAHAFARSGQRTVLVDADLRRPTIAKIFGLDDSVGLTQVLSGQVTLDEALQRVGETGLSVLPAGRIPPNPSELLGSSKMRQLVEELSLRDFVILDVPPLLPVTDGSLLSTAVDGTLMVTQVGRTRKDQTEHAAGMLRKVNGRLLGTILNKAPVKGMGSQYYGFGYSGYQSGYEAYYGEGTSQGARRGRRSRKAARK